MMLSGISIYNTTTNFALTTVIEQLMYNLYHMYNSDFLPYQEPIAGFYPVNAGSKAKYVNLFVKGETNYWTNSPDLYDWMSVVDESQSLYKWELKDTSKDLLAVQYIYNHMRNELYFPFELNKRYILFRSYSADKILYENTIGTSLYDYERLSIVYITHPVIKILEVDTVVPDDVNVIQSNDWLKFVFLRISKDENGNIINPSYGVFLKVGEIIKRELVGEYLNNFINRYDDTKQDIISLTDIIENKFDSSVLQDYDLVNGDNSLNIIDVDANIPTSIVNNGDGTYNLTFEVIHPDVEADKWKVSIKTNGHPKDSFVDGDVLMLVLKFSRQD